MATSAVVIGGGISGVLVARALRLAGIEVTVLEGMHLGAGSSSRTAAGIRQQFSTVSTVQGMRHSVASYLELAEEVGQRVLEQRGYLFLLEDDEALAAARDRVALQHRAGLAEVELLDRAALADRFPAVDTAALAGATWCPTDGFLHPEVVYQEGARRVRELGGRVVVRAPVQAAEVAGDRIVAVQTPQGRFAADVFLDCTNAWTDQLAPVLGATDLPVAPLKRHLWFVRRAGGMTGEELMGLPMIVSPSGVYGRPENPDLLLMGWAHGGDPQPDFTPEDQDRVAPGHAHDAGIDAVPFEAWARLAEVVPAIGAFDGVVATTSGFYGVTPDHNPFLAYDPLRSNLIRLVGFSGHGAMFGPFTAAVGTALVQAGRDLPWVDLPTGRVDLGDFAIGRSFRAPEAMVI
ncbi:MAG: FAD-binding oxidoreductase [Alphaproteobacteria bacterium]|nr:FAD-binding oxidoreductase [Alphaproteobacteria bacterium]